jgi:RNA polymerase sigma-70 factor (ECF subfamily)
MTEQELITKIQNGDEHAFRFFYDQYSPMVYRYIRFRVNSDADAEDLTAEVFVKVWRALPSYEWRGVPLRSWLFRIAYNLIVDKVRSKKFTLANLSTWLRGNGHHEYERIENQDVIAQAFATLSYDEQVILYLSYYESYTNKEIAEVLGKTVSAIGVAKFRALKRLNKILEHSNV